MKTAEEMHQEIQPLLENDWDEAAISAFEKMLVSHPEFAQGHFDLGMLYLKNGDDEKAFQHLERSAALEPENPEYRRIVADFFYAKLGRTEKAYELYRELIGMTPQDADLHFLTGNLAVALHRFDEAIVLYQQVLDLDPRHPEAADYLEKLQAHTAGGPASQPLEVMYARSHELMNAGDESAAQELLEQLVRTHPEFALAYNDLGVLSSRSGDMENALVCYEKAASLDPENVTIQKNLAEFYYIEAGNHVKALEIGLKVLNDNPEDTETLMMAGHISFALGRTDDAKLFYNRVLDIEPWNYEAGESLAKVENNAMDAITGTSASV